MEESIFLKQFEEAAKAIFDPTQYQIAKGQNLFYSLEVNEEMQLAVRDISKPQRGSSAFQTDICISEINSKGVVIPRIVIEFKTKPTTHDILVYSAKAGKHKKIYPWLRYGLLADAINKVPDKFFKHNEYLDFFIAAENYRENIESFAKNLVESELIISKTLERIYFGKENKDFYRTSVEYIDFDNTKNKYA